MVIKGEIKHETLKYFHNIEYILKNIPISMIEADKSKFDLLCNNDCDNFGKNYSYPPYSEVFNVYRSKYKYILVIIHKIDAESYPSIYNTLRMLNTIMKSKQRKIVDILTATLDEKYIAYKALENRIWRLCKVCNLIYNKKCKYLKSIRLILEATGVNVGSLFTMVAELPLQWYIKTNFPAYQMVMSGVLTNQKDILKMSFFINLYLQNSQSLNITYS